MAEKAGLFHWSESQRPNPEKPYKINVVVVSNREEDRTKRVAASRQLVASAVQATTSITIPKSASVSEASSSDKPVGRDDGAWICPECGKSDSKSKAGLKSHIRLNHKK